MKTQLLRTSIFALVAAASVYAESTPDVTLQVQGVPNINRTIPLTVMAMSLAVGASPADVTAGANQAEEPHTLAEWIQVGPDGVMAKDPAEPEKPIRLKLPGHADRKKPPLLMAPHCSTCITNSPFSTWQQLQIALSALRWT
jgi:hypothetical protein